MTAAVVAPAIVAPLLTVSALSSSPLWDGEVEEDDADVDGVDGGSGVDVPAVCQQSQLTQFHPSSRCDGQRTGTRGVEQLFRSYSTQNPVSEGWTYMVHVL